MPPPRVLHVSAAGVYGGNEEHLRTLFAHLDRAAVEAHLAAPEGSSLSRKVLALGFPVHPLRIRGAADLPAAWRLGRLAKGIRADVLHTHNRWEDGLGCLVPGVRWVTTLHDRLNMDQEGNRVRSAKARLYCRILRRADLVMANARATAEDAAREAGLDPGRVLTLTNGQDLSRLEGVEAAPRSGGLRVGLFARVRGKAIQKKGIPEFVEAARRIPGASFLVAGADEAAAAEIRRLAAGIPLEVLTFVEDARPLMKACDVVVCPSRFEGLPRALMEAMGLGRAVVGTRVDGIAEIIEDGTSGLLVPPRDPEALAAAILALAGDGALRARLGEAAAARVRRDYAAGRMAREHEAAYQAIIRRP